MFPVILPLLAQSAPTPISTDWQGNLISFGIIVLIGLNIWEKFKRKPAIDEVLDRRFRELNDQTEKKIEALDRRREQGDKDTTNLVHREVAGIKEFIGEKITANRENNTEKFGAIFAKLDSFQMSMQGLSNDVMHQIGRLEGQMDGAKKG